MVTAGIDVGTKFTKVILLKNGKVVGRGYVLSGFDQKQAVEEAFNQALNEANLRKEDVEKIVATGAGKELVSFADSTITEVGAAARGAASIFPEARTVVDIGAEEGRVLKMNESGKVMDFVLNDKCAAGAGSFLESMSRALEVPLEEMGLLALKASKAVPMNAQCVVFAESEVVSLIHAKKSKAEISKSIHEALAGRISSMLRRIGLQKEVALIGGLAKNPGIVQALEEELEVKVLLPEEPDFVSALGAAIVATEKIIA